ncbi:uncharacterized protein LOC127935360 [Carassius gibelio]|uniref:uncharacterized protein LOC127935360 n=1 Tax=Carassius gibelio TaxID=101364 RepID=UPI002277D2F9|nr:uncharacterized protein LOC127935360 [Carassius gibelio]
MPHLLNLLLLFCLFSETSPILVIGIKGDRVVFSCGYEGSEIPDVVLSRSGIMDVCETEECRGRVFKEGNCDVVINNLIFSDAGKYTLRIYYNNGLEPQIKIYQLCVDDEVSVNMGEQLKLDVLLSEADEVQHQSRRSTDWRKVWSRSDGVQSQRISIRDRNLIISNFTARDTGTYEVLDSEGEILIMVKVRVSSTASAKTGSKGKLNNTNDDTEEHNPCLLPEELQVVQIGLSVFFLILVAVKRRQILHHLNIV